MDFGYNAIGKVVTDLDIRVAVVGTLYAASILPVEGQLFLVGDNVNALELVDSCFNLQKTFRICICFREKTHSLSLGDTDFGVSAIERQICGCHVF
jgi:hypothetical protein